MCDYKDVKKLNVELNKDTFKFREKEDGSHMGRTAYEYDPKQKYGPDYIRKKKKYTDAVQNKLMKSAVKRMAGDEYLQGIHGKLSEMKKQSKEEMTEYQQDYSNFLTEQLKLDESKYNNEDKAEMQNVKSGLRTLTNFLMTPITQDQQKNLSMHVVELEEQYDDVIRACEEYEKTHNPWFPTGKKRLKMVKDMKAFCKKERAVLTPALAQFLESGHEGDITWGEIIYNVRAVVLDKSNMVKAKGGAISDIYKISLDGGQTHQYLSYEQDNAMHDIMSSLMKAVENVRKDPGEPDMPSTPIYQQMAEDLSQVVSTIKKKSPEEQKKLQAELLKVVFEPYSLRTMPAGLKEMWHAPWNDVASYILPFCNKFLPGFTLLDTLNMNRIHKDAVLSRRNVATSRLSAMLGMDDLIAKSRTVLVKNENGNLERANLMDEAGGVSFASIKKRAADEKKKIAYTPEAARQLVRLEFFDMICGQIDRHENNYNVDVEEHDGKLVVTGIHVFDNDMSFSDHCFNDIRTGIGYSSGLFYRKHGENIDNKLHKEHMAAEYKLTAGDGETEIFQYMDRSLYEHIVNMDEHADYLVLQLVDLGISKSEIDGLKDRIHGIREYLDTAIRAHGEEHFLLSKEEWGQLNNVTDIQKGKSLNTKIFMDPIVEGSLWKSGQ